MAVTRSLKIAALIVLTPAISFAEIVVTHYEPLQQLQVIETDGKQQSFRTQAPQAPQAPQASLQFLAMGQEFHLQLETNDRVAAGLAAAGDHERIQIYRGELRGLPGSWARIVVFDGAPSGVFFDGDEMYAIESPGDSALMVDRPVIYRLADALISPGTMSCAADSLAGRASAVAKVIVGASKTAVARGPGALSEITISAIGDFEFTDLRGGDVAAAAAIAARMNNIDGYYSEQIGVQLTLQQPIETHADASDPFSDTIDSDLLLDELSEYRLQTPTHNSTGLTHLWTGRDLAGSTVGIAWRGVLCLDYFGAALSEGRGGAFIDSLIAAHEIGHNFGAEHDGEAGTSCPDATDNYIMSASVGGSQQFSACSIDIIQAQAAAAACVTALPAVDVSIFPKSDFSELLLGVATNIEYQVSSNGTLDATNVRSSFTLPANLALDGVTASVGSCSTVTGTVACELGNLVGLTSETITLSVTPLALGGGTLTAAVATSGSDERSENNQDMAAYSIVAPVDLVARRPTASDVVVDSTTTVTASIENVAITDATNITADIVLENGIQALAADWSIGSCTVTAQRVDCQADLLPAMSSSTLTIDVSAVQRGRRDVTVTLSAAEPDATPGDNSVAGEVVVIAADQQNDDSGGGSTSPLLLLLGLASLLARTSSRGRWGSNKTLR